MSHLTALVDRLWLRAVLVCLTAAVVIVVIAYATQEAQRDDDQVHDTLTDFVNAAADHDGDGACGLLTRNAQRALSAPVPGTTCPTYARSFGFDVAGLGGVTLHLARDLPARVTLDASNMTAADDRPVRRRVVLVRTGEGYRIDMLAR